ncbi:MAG: NAD-dependent epimerase/dehydratase family protein [Thermoleophilaceae bacterium]
MARMLVTGGAGFIGSHLARTLLDEGAEVDIVDDLSTGSQANLPDGAELVRLDLGANGAADRLPDRDYDAVLHLAGQSSGEKSFDDPEHDLAANARSTLMLGLWARRRGVPVFLHASSMGVYGRVDDPPAAEDRPLRPISYYGASKLAAEHALRVMDDESFRTVSFRMFSVYGPGQDLAELRQGMASIYLAYLLRGEQVPVRGSLDRVRDLVHVDDVVAAWRSALDSQARGPLNLGSGVPVRVGDLIADLVAACGLPADHPVVQEPGTPGDQFGLWADTTRIRRELGWEPLVERQEGISALVAWARAGS